MESRRKFIKNISAVTAGLNFLPLVSGITIPESHLFISESNSFPGSNRPFTLGILKVASVTGCEAKISAIRKKHHYRTPFRYRSTDKFKEPYAKDLLDYFIQEKSISFLGRTISGKIDSTEENYLRVKTLSYYTNYRKAITDALSQNEISTIYLGNHDDELKAFLKKNIPAAKEVKYTNDDLYQFSQFLAGSVSADQSGIKNEMKISLIKYLKDRIGIKEPNKLHSATNSKFKVISARV